MEAEIDYKRVLEQCRQGKVTEELKRLYLIPQRDKVPWSLFPDWARPHDPVEGAHEG